MKFELKYKVYGNLKISETLKIQKYPYEINLFEENNCFYISIAKPIDIHSNCIPVFEMKDDQKTIKLPEKSCYQDMEEIINHIESFGALDNKLEYIDKLNVIMKWIPDNKNDHVSPLSKIERKIIEERDLTLLSEDWLWQTVIHKNQLDELYIPFSFFTDGKLMFNSMRYQSSFCTFYMMLEYFFNENSWGINNDAYKRDKCLRICLKHSLNNLKEHPKHFDWLNGELINRKKMYDEEGLLFTINMYRNDLSHAVKKDKNRNPFKEHEYFSLAFITMMICLSVSIKKRLLPFVHPDNVDSFLEK